MTAMFNGFNVPAQKKKSAKKLNEFLNITSSTGLKYDNINTYYCCNRNRR